MSIGIVRVLLPSLHRPGFDGSVLVCEPWKWHLCQENEIHALMPVIALIKQIVRITDFGFLHNYRNCQIGHFR